MLIAIAIIITVTACLILLRAVWHQTDNDVYKLIDALPSKVLASITASVSSQKGKLSELVAYMQLRGSYDRVIALGNIVDFICIRFPTETTPGTMDFIDIKNGKSARLSHDQKMLSDLIKHHNIQFLKIRIDTDPSSEVNPPTDSQL